MEDSVMLKQAVKCLCVYEMKAYRTALLAIGKKITRQKLNNINLMVDGCKLLAIPINL